MKLKGKQISLGSYETEEMASFIYKEAKRLNIEENNNELEIKEKLKIYNKNLNRGISNKTGFKGVYEKNGKYRARFRTRKTSLELGSFDTPEEAHQAYLKAKNENA